MPANDFAKFVESQQVRDSVEQVDWDKMREEWLDELDVFFGQIRDFLDEYLRAGSITYTFTDISLTEENLGTYSARKMNIQIGRQHVSLAPIGTLLIGCKGRVDAVGAAGRAQILLLNNQVKSAGDLFKVTVSIGGKPSFPSPPPAPQPIHWAWKIVTQTPNRQFVDLNKESFFALLMEIANA